MIGNQRPGPIDPNLLYPLETFKATLGIKAATLRTARRNGLIVRYVGRVGFILGKDFIDYVRTYGRQEH